MNRIFLNKGVYVGLALAISVISANEKAGPGPKDSSGSAAKSMSSMDMMGKSDMKCKAKCDSLDALLKAVQEARKSDDKAKMKAALELTEAHIVGMKEHMGKCMPMKGMKDKKMGGDGMMEMGSGHHCPPEKEESTEHEKHHPK